MQPATEARHITRVALAAERGEPCSIIRIRNIEATPRLVGCDAWSRGTSGGFKPQPVRVSASVWLRQEFKKSAVSDVVDEDDTVHYGKVAKAIVSVLEAVQDDPTLAEAMNGLGIRFLVGLLLEHLVGYGFGREMRTPVGEDQSIFAVEEMDERNRLAEKLGRRPLLTSGLVKCIEVEVRLPKATRTGDGASYSGMLLFGDTVSNKEGRSVSFLGSFNECLRLHRLKIPTLVGVNDYERGARQNVTVDIEIDGMPRCSENVHGHLETTIQHVMAESSFATLEALASSLHDRLRGTMKPYIVQVPEGNAAPYRIRIRLEKPVAVPLAEAAVVESTTAGWIGQ